MSIINMTPSIPNTDREQVSKENGFLDVIKYPIAKSIKKTNKGVAKGISPSVLFDYLSQEKNIYKWVNDSDTSFMVSIDSFRRVKIINEQQLRDTIKKELDAVETSPDVYLSDVLERCSFLYDEKKIFTFLKEKEFNFLRSGKEKSYKFAKNGVIEISPDAITLISWEEWKNNKEYEQYHILQDDVLPFIYNPETNASSVLERFARDIFLNFEQGKIILGYGFSNSPMYPFNTMVNFADADKIGVDASEIDDKQQGGRGKSLIFDMFSYYKTGKKNTSCKINGRRKSSDYFTDPKTYSQAYKKATQGASIDIIINDISPKFDFNELNSFITDGFTIEKKYCDPITLEKERVKLFCTSNTAIPNTDESTARRIVTTLFKPTYNSKRSPYDEHGDLMQDDYNEANFSFLIQCEQEFLRDAINNYSTLKETTMTDENKRARRLYNECRNTHEFFSQHIYEHLKIGKKSVVVDFDSLFLKYNNNDITYSTEKERRAFSSQLMKYLDIQKIEYIKKRKGGGGRTVEYTFFFNTLEEEKQQEEISFDITPATPVETIETITPGDEKMTPDFEAKKKECIRLLEIGNYESALSLSCAILEKYPNNKELKDAKQKSQQIIDFNRARKK